MGMDTVRRCEASDIQRGRALPCLAPGTVQIGRWRLCTIHAAMLRAGQEPATLGLHAPQGPTPPSMEVGHAVQFHPGVPLFAGMLGFVEALTEGPPVKAVVAVMVPDPESRRVGVVRATLVPEALLFVGVPPMVPDFGPLRSVVAGVIASAVAEWVAERLPPDQACQHCGFPLKDHGHDLGCPQPASWQGQAGSWDAHDYRFAMTQLLEQVEGEWRPMDFEDRSPCRICDHPFRDHGTEQEDTTSCPFPVELDGTEEATEADWFACELHFRPAGEGGPS